MVKVKKLLFTFLMVFAISLTFLSYIVFANAEVVRETFSLDAATVAKTNLAQISFEERMKHVRGNLFSLNETVTLVFENFVGPKLERLSVELVKFVSWQGTYLKVNDQDIYISSGGTKYINGWLIRHRGNIEGINGTVYSNIDTFYVGPDTECGLADHYECIKGNLHWLYCNSTDYGMVEECDACGDNECIKKGTFARWDRIRDFKKTNSGPTPRSEGLPVMEKEINPFVSAVSGISE